MPPSPHPPIPVLLLHNMDPSWTPHERETEARAIDRLVGAMRQLGHAVTSLPAPDANISVTLQQHNPDENVVFNWCENLPGVPHSESLVPDIIESLHFVYTGSSSGVLALSEDKRQVKERLVKRGIPTPEWCVCDPDVPTRWQRFPAIVKPVHEHCSLGISSDAVVMDEAQMRERIAYVRETFAQPALVEDFIDGREFHVSLWGNGHIEMLPPVEMDFSALGDVRDRLCTYDSKFTRTSTHYRKIKSVAPAPLDEAELTALEGVSRAAYTEIGCRDYARIDVRLRDGLFHVLDVNHNPDISADASMASAAKLMGYSHGEMASRLVSLAAIRHPRFRPDPV
jgi:D-alanine-D-alanine ligase